MLSKSLREIYIYVLKVGCSIKLENVHRSYEGTVYRFSVLKKTAQHDMAGIIQLSDEPWSIHNTEGLINVEYGSTEDVFDVMKRLRDPLGRGTI